jgi:phytanoyl-CoA hydroxylase
MTTAPAQQRPKPITNLDTLSSPWIDLPKPASQDQVKFFVDNGYLAMPGLIKPEELEELKADTLKVARGGYPCTNLMPVDAGLTDAQVLERILCIHQPHYLSPVMLKYVKHPQMCGVLSQITAAHLPFWDGSVKCMQSMLFVKPPGFQGQAWHQDEIYIPTRDRSLIGAWIAIDDATIENGCLYVMPGTHKRGYLYPQRPHNWDEEWDFAPESYGFDESQKIPVEVKAGTVVFFNGYLLHTSYKNKSKNVYRRVLVNHYMNSWSHLPWSIGEGESPARADRRNIVPVAGTDPYAWKGYEPFGQNVFLRQCKAVRDMNPEQKPEAAAPLNPKSPTPNGKPAA